MLHSADAATQWKTRSGVSWECTVCTYVNKMTTKCIVCDSWRCTQCTRINESVIEKCSACFQQKCYNARDDQKPSEFSRDPADASAMPKPSTIITTMTAFANARGRVFTCDCKTNNASRIHGVYCGKHLQLMIFQEYPVRASKGYPESIDDMRYIGSAINGDIVFAMLNGPRVRTMLSKVSVQYTNASSAVVPNTISSALPEDASKTKTSTSTAFLVFDSEHVVAGIIISKSRFGIEILGPGIEVVQKMYDYVHCFKRPICIEVTISDSTNEQKNSGGSYDTHGVLLAIIPPTPPEQQLGRVYLLDPNTNSQVSNYRSKDIENVLNALLPNDPRFAFVPQDTWLKGKSYYINGSYADLGVGSGWCRTISILMAGLITRCDSPMSPENVLPYIAKLPKELCIMMFDATIRHVVSHLLTSADCEKIVAQREMQRLKHEESLKKPPRVPLVKK